jgi:hypothetical protein
MESKMMNAKESLEAISSLAEDEHKLLVISTAYWLQLAFDDMVMQSFDEHYID